ncbi:MAG TPA: multiheme c-type cytochrome [Candidatus Acidoferrales bacterium]|nr:multiheme c-type cytochrome [Candidatus Acidoferrales bacterium]
MRGAVLLAVLAVPPAFGAGSATYAGAAVCAKCHAAIHQTWTQSRHSKMVQPATKAAVQGDFTRAQVRLHGALYRLRERDGVFYISESTLTGREQEHRVDYTLGNRRIQHYLTRLPSGRIVVLAPSWDILRKQWFHNTDIADPDETDEALVQIWNKNCYSCHVSQQEKNFDSARNAYKTAWLDFGTNCERCHGPAGEHVAHYSAAEPPRGPANDIVVQTRLDAARNTMVCAQCHSFRDIYVNGFAAGDNYYDHFLPILESTQPHDNDPAYWPDGRTRRFSNDAFGLWQSECYLKGKAVCTNCHVTPHLVEIDKNPQLRPDSNALCAQCHGALTRDVAAHSHHAANSKGSSCVECHMPRTVYSIKAEIRDHSLSIPAPENTLNHGIPNACNVCHKDRDANWAVAKMNQWWSAASRQKLIRRADAFAKARANDPAAVPLLLDILALQSEGPLPRANALGYLARFSGAPGVYQAFERSLADPEPLVRANAALRIAVPAANKPAAVAALAAALGDEAATVRLSAAVSLVGMGVRDLPGDDGRRFASARLLYQKRAELNSDDAEQQLGAGRFYLLRGEPAKALAALEASLKLEPGVEAKYLLAAAHAEQGQYREARELLLAIRPADPQYPRAQRLLKAIENK